MSYCHVHDAVAVDEYGIRYYVDVEESNSLYLVWADGPGCHLGVLESHFDTEQMAVDWAVAEAKKNTEEFMRERPDLQ